MSTQDTDDLERPEQSASGSAGSEDCTSELGSDACTDEEAAEGSGDEVESDPDAEVEEETESEGMEVDALAEASESAESSSEEEEEEQSEVVVEIGEMEGSSSEEPESEEESESESSEEETGVEQQETEEAEEEVEEEAEEEVEETTDSEEEEEDNDDESSGEVEATEEAESESEEETESSEEDTAVQAQTAEAMEVEDDDPDDSDDQEAESESGTSEEEDEDEDEEEGEETEEVSVEPQVAEETSDSEVMEEEEEEEEEEEASGSERSGSTSDGEQEDEAEEEIEELPPLGAIPEDSDDAEFVGSAESSEAESSEAESSEAERSGAELGERLRHSLRSADQPNVEDQPRKRRRVVPELISASDEATVSDSARALKAAQDHAPRKRKLAASLLALTAGLPNDSEAATPVRAQSPPAILDKPREERSYREFFPDLAEDAPLLVQFRRAESSGQSSVASTPVPQTTEPSSLTIKLLFNDPNPPQSPPVALGRGKGAGSFSGTPQSSVVVLAPKKPVLALPSAQVRKLEGQAAQYRPAEFERPSAHYIRNVELTETDLAEMVEYDLEDIDREWLRQANRERAESGVASDVSANVLETIVDGLEKEWFDLTKDAQKAISAQHQEQLPAEDAACAICGEEECDNTNAIVFCDGCNLAVHQDCYGVPYIPEGQWLCRRCMLAPDKAVACMFCPQRGGAFKKTTANKWAHLLCALWIPEVGIANTVYMEPIDSVDQIPRSRWRLYCHLCHRKQGACIQCAHRQCVTAFHATCARKARLAMIVKQDRLTGEPVFRAYCEKHTPASHRAQIDLAAPLKAISQRRVLSSASASLARAANGHSSPATAWPPTSTELLRSPTAETARQFQAASRGSTDASLRLTMAVYNPDRPVLNAHVYGRVLRKLATARSGLAQRPQLVAQVARYWALKRAMRHGAPLLKRLHLEPWTASATQQRALEMAEGQRQAFVRRLRTDLERVRLLVESVRRREREKLKRTRLQIDYLQQAIDPLTPIMRSVIDELIDKRDPRGVLSRPVSADEAPDYLSLIHQPMDFGTIRQKLDEFEYRGMDEFERDLLLVVNNCTTYNKPGTYYFRLAVRVKKHIERLMGEARRKIERLPIDPKTGRMLVDIDMDIFALNSRVPEPPSPLQADTDSKALAPAETDPKEPSPAADNGSQPVVQADLPMTRSRSRTKAEEEAAPMTNGTSKAAPTNGHADGRPPKNMRGWAWVAEPADDVEDPRRLTLFEQLSVPPPDIRRSSRARRQTPDPSVPDDINVITTRLRKDSGKTQKRPHESPPPVEMAAPAKRAKTRHAQAMQQDVEYRPGTLVWAKMASYPWFPAEIVDPKSPRAPEEVHKDRHADSVALVCFFGASRSWKWVAGQHVCRLGVSMEDDRRLYKAKLSRSAGMAKNVRAAYAEACQSGGIEPLAP